MSNDQHLPAAVRQANEEANRLIQGNQLENPAEAAPNPEEKPDAIEQRVEPELQNEPEPIQEPDKDALYWQHRFNVLQGKYNAEITALNDQVKTLESKVSELEAGSGSSAQVVTGDAMNQLKEDFGEEGAELVNQIVSQVKSESESRIKSLEQKLNSQESEKADDAHAKFWVDVKTNIPNFDQVNNDPKFVQWLGEEEGYSGQTRQGFLDQAASQLNSERVIRIFNDFMKVGRKPSSNVPDSKINPGQVRASQAPADNEIITQGFVKEFYDDVVKGNKYTKEEAAAIEQRINVAMVEGRIQ